MKIESTFCKHIMLIGSCACGTNKNKYLVKSTSGILRLLRILVPIGTLFVSISGVHASPTPTFWSDSYDAGDGICRCDSSYDHGIDTTMVDTPCDVKSVPEVCGLILEKYGVGPVGNRTYYNSVQCGMQPYNNVIDETVCPGIPEDDSVRPVGNWSGPQCFQTGAAWPLEGICETEPTNLDCTESSWLSGTNQLLSAARECISLSPPEKRFNLWNWLIAFLGASLASVALIKGVRQKEAME